MIFIILILLAIIIILSTITYNQVSKVAKYENIVQDQVEFLRSISTTIQESQEYLNNLDEKGTFKSDDEVGYFFEQLMKIQQELDRYRLPTNYGK